MLDLPSSVTELCDSCCKDAVDSSGQTALDRPYTWGRMLSTGERFETKKNWSTFITSCPSVTSPGHAWVHNCHQRWEQPATNRRSTGKPQQGRRLILLHRNIPVHVAIKYLAITAGYLSYKLLIQIQLSLPNQNDNVSMYKVHRCTSLIASVKKLILVQRKCRVVQYQLP